MDEWASIGASVGGLGVINRPSNAAHAAEGVAPKASPHQPQALESPRRMDPARVDFLAVDGVGRQPGAAWFRDGVCLTHVRADPQAPAAATLAPTVADLLRATGSRPAFIAVHRGPGAFTPLRMSLALAAGLGQSLGVPVVGVDGFSLMAWALRRTYAEARPMALAVLFDARMGEIVGAVEAPRDGGNGNGVVDTETNTLLAPHGASPEAFAQRLGERWSFASAPTMPNGRQSEYPLALTGDATAIERLCMAWAGLDSGEFPWAIFPPPPVDAVTLGEWIVARGSFPPPSEIPEPLYGQLSAAERKGPPTAR